VQVAIESLLDIKYFIAFSHLSDWLVVRSESIKDICFECSIDIFIAYSEIEKGRQSRIIFNKNSTSLPLTYPSIQKPQKNNPKKKFPNPLKPFSNNPTLKLQILYIY
jgi:hypothetical protein